MRYIRIFFFLLLILVALASGRASATAPEVNVLEVNGTIVPVVADYISRGISEAEARNAAAVVIELNTPGGVLDSTQKIVERIMNAKVPVIVYVTPKGARAASAGVFITLSAHIAAMAPGTSIGAAHPVALSPGGQEMPETMKEKVTNYAVSWIKSIAEERGRNAAWAESAVRGSATLTDREALEKNVIDLRAQDLNSLLLQINGLRVKVGNEEVTINTQGYVLHENKMSFLERFLHAISEPNIAYILLTLGTLGLIVEISHPGLMIPGIVGALSLILAFYSLSVLNAYWAGIILILLAFALFIAEIFVTSHGALTAGGIASLIIGSLILFKGGPPGFEIRVDRWLIAVMATLITGVFAFIIQAVVRTQRKKQPTGQEGLIDMVAVVKTPLNPRGTVFVHGELWEAILEEGQAEPGEEVIVTKVEGLKLRVKKIDRR